MLSISVFFVIGLIIRISANDDDSAYEEDHTLVVKPAELAGLVLKERIKSELKKSRSCRGQHTKTTVDVDFGDLQIPDNSGNEIDESDDNDMLRNRKIWSRWSKWGSCSVSCGSGFMSRRRACVAGRCARDELEEQRRPCRLTPCPQPQTLDPNGGEPVTSSQATVLYTDFHK